MIKTATEIALDAFAKECARLIRTELERASKTCVRCEHFDEKFELCRLNNLRPPARIIAEGCECFTEEIPF